MPTHLGIRIKFVLSCVKYDKDFITSRPDCVDAQADQHSHVFFKTSRDVVQNRREYDR